jgi:hypothetical protein
MKKSIKNTVLALSLALAALSTASSAVAQEWPMVAGDYWTVTGIEVKDGGDLKYANWLAAEWKKNAEFAISKGWLKSYRVFGNVHNRKGEPDLYLVRVFESMPSGPEGEKRYEEYMEWQSKTEAQMEAESGNRAEYREVMSTMLIQEMMFRD